jgi:DNA-binding GntR family transcriptional regulator
MMGGSRTLNNGESLADNVYQRLRAKILTHELRPGARLVEDELTRSLDTGRTPVREALLLLQGEGLIVREKGWVVQAVDTSSVRAIFETRIAIEGYATRLAAERLAGDDFAALQEMVASMDRPMEMSHKQLNRVNQSFHETIVRASGNSLLLQFHEKTQFHYWTLREPVAFSDDLRAQANAQHHEIVKALARRDADCAEALARAHVATTMEIVCRVLGD